MGSLSQATNRERAALYLIFSGALSWTLWARWEGWFHHDIWVYASRGWSWPELIRPADGHLSITGVVVSKLYLEAFEFVYPFWNVFRGFAWVMALGFIAWIVARSGVPWKLAAASALLLVLTPLTIWMEGWYVAWMISVAGGTWLAFYVSRVASPSIREAAGATVVASIVALSTTFGVMIIGGIGLASLIYRRFRWLVPLGVPLLVYGVWLVTVRGFNTAAGAIDWGLLPSTTANLFGAAIVGHVPHGSLTGVRVLLGVFLLTGVVAILILRRRFVSVAGAFALIVYILATFAFRVSSGRTDGLAAHYILTVTLITGFWIVLPEIASWSRRTWTVVASALLLAAVPAALYQARAGDRLATDMGAYRDRVEAAAVHVWAGLPYHEDARIGTKGPLVAQWLVGFERNLGVDQPPEGRHAELGVGDASIVKGRLKVPGPAWIGPTEECSTQLDRPEVITIESATATTLLIVVPGSEGLVELGAGSWWVDVIDGVSSITADEAVCESRHEDPRPLMRMTY